MNKSREFHRNSLEKAEDIEHRRKMNYSLSQSDKAFLIGKQQFCNLEAARKNANLIKWRTIEKLHDYLEQFETNFTKRGGKVIWAVNAAEAIEEVLKICKQKNARIVVKSKSMVTEEIDLNKNLCNQGIEIVETDLGEYIQQLAGETPYHIVAPSLHKSKEEVASLFETKLGAAPGLPPEQLTLVAREKLRLKFQQAEIGITGANFLLADIGGVAITENEGNARLGTCFPKTHIVITGIEKILPSVHDVKLFWPLLATFGSGQNISVYNTIFTGPRQPKETDGPDEMYVILLDNGRTKLLADPEVRESLFCIRCGACLNVCPVYKNIGGHAYGTTYSGPIGAVIVPHLKGIEEFNHLSFASSLCGACTATCPVGINLHHLLLYNRKLAITKNKGSFIERLGWRIWKTATLRRWMMDTLDGRIKNFLAGSLFGKVWGKRRFFPSFPQKSFNASWKSIKRKFGN